MARVMATFGTLRSRKVTALVQKGGPLYCLGIFSNALCENIPKIECPVKTHIIESYNGEIDY